MSDDKEYTAILGPEIQSFHVIEREQTPIDTQNQLVVAIALLSRNKYIIRLTAYMRHMARGPEGTALRGKGR